MIGLEQHLDRLFADAASRAFGDDASGFDATVRPSKHADYQVNGALALGKRLGRAPREVAQALVDVLDAGDALSTIEVAGPGFVNCTYSPSFLARLLTEQSGDARLGQEPADVARTFVIDYSSPNIAKNMHVGHLRTTVIGDAIVRLLESRGDTVIRQNHLGDWGTQFGMLIEHLIDSGDPEGTAEAAVEDLDSLYREARAKFDSDEAFARRARERVVALQRGDAQTLALWHTLVDTSQRYFDAVYERLGVLLTPEDNRGESFYNDMLEDTVADLESKGLLSVSDGALCAFPPGFVGRDGEPFPLIVRKSDGGYGYAATDLATARHNVEVVKGNCLLYVTDARQAQHFAMVFAVARQAGWLPDDVETVHIGYGMVLGDDGKPFKTRSGEVVQLAALLDEAVERAEQAMTERTSESSDDERRRIAHAVGIGAVKWFDLKNEHTNNYVFDFDRMLAFNGNTGPYVQYASTRAKSVLRKAGVADAPMSFTLTEEAERQLALALPQLGTAIDRALEEYEPHHVCGYLFDLADRFTSFYEQCPVLSAEGATRDSRLALCALTARVMDRGLSLLGIESVDRM